MLQDVWEVGPLLEDLAEEREPLAAALRDTDLTRPQLDSAVRYSEAYPEEIAARFELDRSETAAADAA